MKPHEQCKAEGLKSLTELSTLTGVSIQTLNNWSKNKARLFKIVLLGSQVKRTCTLCSIYRDNNYCPHNISQNECNYAGECGHKIMERQVNDAN